MDKTIFVPHNPHLKNFIFERIALACSTVKNNNSDRGNSDIRVKPRATLCKTMNVVIASESPPTSLRSLSIPKCAVLKTVPDDIVYLLDGHPLPLVPSIRDLGVIFDSDLKFRSHIVHVAKMAGRVSNLIMRTFILTDPALYITLYRTLVIPRFLYCSTVWYPT